MPTTGWAGGGFDLAFAYSLGNLYVYRSGALVTTVLITGGTDFSALFEEWRINSVEVSMMYGANSLAPGPNTGPQGPIFLAAFDPNDTSVITLGSILQYNSLRVIQMANVRGESGAVMKMTPRAQLNATAATTGISALAPVGQFFSTDNVAIQHNGMKLVYDPAGSSYAAVIGTVTFYFKINYSFRGSK